jgi:hypothetical protein
LGEGGAEEATVGGLGGDGAEGEKEEEGEQGDDVKDESRAQDLRGRRGTGIWGMGATGKLAWSVL